MRRVFFLILGYIFEHMTFRRRISPRLIAVMVAPFALLALVAGRMLHIDDVPSFVEGKSAYAATPADTRGALLPASFPDQRREIFVNLKAALVIDNNSGSPLYAFSADSVRPVASISKLVSAITLLDMDFPRDSMVTITREDARRSSKSNLYVGDRVEAGDLLYVALIGSDNRAIRALGRTFGGSQENFARLMNKTCRKIGMRHTTMVEPSGLSKENVSNATDCALLVNYGLRYKEIMRASSKKSYRFAVTNRRGKHLYRKVITTNRLVYSRYKTLVGKTGFILAADYCLATILEDSKGRRLTVVALGAPRSSIRFKEARRLADFGFRKLRKASGATKS
jgi:serine-type D-Ala-D-Ala endopeptidase (penicillin-binding protein 7)